MLVPPRRQTALTTVLVMMLAACSSSPESDSLQAETSISSGTSSPGAAIFSACAAADLELDHGGPISEATGQESRVLRLSNTSAEPCQLKGYPTIVLADNAGNQIPFVYRDGGDQMVTSEPPILVTLAPGKAAYMMFNKYRCDLGDKARATSVTVTVPGETTALSLSMGVYSNLPYCGPGDPGSVVEISPIEPTVKDLLEAH